VTTAELHQRQQAKRNDIRLFVLYIVVLLIAFHPIDEIEDNGLAKIVAEILCKKGNFSRQTRWD